MFDESLLRRLEEDGEVERVGRSAVVRRAVEMYLRDAERELIADQYKQAYATGEAAVGQLEGWSEEGAGPAETSTA